VLQHEFDFKIRFRIHINNDKRAIISDRTFHFFTYFRTHSKDNIMGTIILALLFIGVLFGLMALFGLTQPKIATLERSIEINTSSEEAFNKIASLKAFVTWSPWSKKDPAMQQTFLGVDGAVGSVYTWKGNNKVGQGMMTLTAITPGKQANMDVDFGQRGKASTQLIVTSTAEGKTTVTWKFESNMGTNPIMRCAQPMMRKVIGNDYQNGLANLKQQLEA